MTAILDPLKCEQVDHIPRGHGSYKNAGAWNEVAHVARLALLPNWQAKGGVSLHSKLALLAISTEYMDMIMGTFCFLSFLFLKKRTPSVSQKEANRSAPYA